MRICVVHHTDCAMVGPTDDEIRSRISTMRGVDALAWSFLASADQLATLREELEG